MELRVVAWPYPGAVGLVERGPDLTQIHVVRDWHYLGSAPTKAKARKLDAVVAGFDNDGYRILVKPVLSQSYEMLQL
jgi:excinuclease Cho